MGKNKNLSPRKKEQVNVLLKHSDFKQKEIAKKLNISTQTVGAIRKKLEIGRLYSRDQASSKCAFEKSG